MNKSTSLYLISLMLLSGCSDQLESFVNEKTGPAIREEVSSQVSKNVRNSALLVTEGLFGTMTFNQLSAAMNGSLYSGNQTFASQAVSESEESEFQETVRKIIYDLLSDATQGLSLGWVKIASNKNFCATVAEGDAEIACREFLGHISFKHRFTGLHKGELNAYYDSFWVASLKYSASSLVGEIKVNVIPAVFTGLSTAFQNHGIDLGLPAFSDANGVVKATLSRAENEIQLKFDVMQSIDISGSATGAEFHLEVAAGSSISGQYNRGLGKTIVELNLREIDFALDTDSNTEAKIHQSLTGKLLIDSSGLTLQNIHLPGSGFTLEVDDQLQVGVSVNSLNAGISFMQDGFSMDLEQLDVSVTTTDGTSSWNALPGGRFTLQGTQPLLWENEVLSLQNTGSFGSPLTVQSGECLSGLPFQIVSCM